MFERGLIIGKFMPFHRGHEYLIRFAMQHCDTLDVIVCTNRQEPLEGHRRWQCVARSLAGLQECKVNVLWYQNDLPQEPEGITDEAFWKAWVRGVTNEVHYLKGIGPRGRVQYDALFASEDYAWRFARELGAEYVPVNPIRSIVPISATKIRENPLAYWEYLTEEAREDYVQTIVIGGPESCGKSTMCKLLADEFKTIYVPEYGRDFYEMRNLDINHVRYEHMELIAHGHFASVDAAKRHANRRLFVDTDIFSTILFSKVYFKKVPEDLYLDAESWKPNLTLVCKPNVEWVPDQLRNLGHLRDQFFEDYIDLLEEYRLPYKVIDGGQYGDRLLEAVKHVHALGGVPKAVN